MHRNGSSVRPTCVCKIAQYFIWVANPTFSKTNKTLNFSVLFQKSYFFALPLFYHIKIGE